MKHGQIQDAWETRNELHAKGDERSAEGNKLVTEGNRLHAEGDNLLAKSSSFYAEGRRHRADGDKLYRDAVIEKHGPESSINWETGEIETN
jgi:hypothetical protein